MATLAKSVKTVQPSPKGEDPSRLLKPPSLEAKEVRENNDLAVSFHVASDAFGNATGVAATHWVSRIATSVQAPHVIQRRFTTAASDFGSFGGLSPAAGTSRVWVGMNGNREDAEPASCRSEVRAALEKLDLPVWVCSVSTRPSTAVTRPAPCPGR